MHASAAAQQRAAVMASACCAPRAKGTGVHTKASAHAGAAAAGRRGAGRLAVPRAARLGRRVVAVVRALLAASRRAEDQKAKGASLESVASSFLNSLLSRRPFPPTPHTHTGRR